MILDTNGIKALYIEVVVDARKRFAFQLFNFSIMGNHVHLLIKPLKKENLSRIMQWINGVFAMRYNRIFRIKGHVWGQRFYSVILRHVYEFVRAFDYIDNNPVAAKLVCQAEDWLFGGVRHARDGCYRVLSPPDTLLGLLYPERHPRQLAAL